MIVRKIKVMKMEECRMKDYVKRGTLYSVRKMWEVRSYMLKVAGNYPGHRKYEVTGWQCQACNQEVREDQDHLAHCTGYSDLLEGKDISNDEDMLNFFSLVMNRREEMGWD